MELDGNASERLPLLVDQGGGDEFLNRQLRLKLLKEAGEKAGYPVQINMREGYDHSYYFIASFMREHMAFHAKVLT